MSISKFRQCIFAILTTFVTLSMATSIYGDEFLPMSKAFQGSITSDNSSVQVEWTITPEHYLYEKSLDIKIDNPDSNTDVTLGKLQISPKGKLKHDEFMGEVTVHNDKVTLTRPYALAQGKDVTIIATFQGCAEAGLCYPPSKIKTTLPLTAADAAVSDTQTPPPASENSSSLNDNSIWKNIFWFFLLGLGLSLTPCVLPMVPILSSVILGSDKQQLSARRGFGLSTSYVLGMALVYTFAGLMVALGGARLQIYMQHPYVLWPLATSFLVLAVSLFGAFEIRLPNRLHNTLYQFQSTIPGGQYFGVFIIGALSAIVVSPCVSAPLAGILLYIAQEGSAFTGAASLFALAMGMGAPLIVLGTTGANVLPKAGMWMERVKTFFGFLMIAMAIYLVKHLIPDAYLSFICGALIAFFAVWIGALHQTTPESSTLSLLGKAIGLCLLLIAALLVQTGWYTLFPSANTTVVMGGSAQGTQQQLDFHTATTLDELEKALQQAKSENLPAMVDLYADWCIACIEFEKITFVDPEVKKSLQQLYLIKLDITEDIETTKILDHFELIGPPTLLFYDQAGEEMKELRVTGFMEAKPFMEVLKQIN